MAWSKDPEHASKGKEFSWVCGPEQENGGEITLHCANKDCITV